MLAYDLARRTGRYASRTRFCELVLNGDYRGVYVLMERIKRDRARVDIARLRPDEVEGDDLTGGYIFKVDRPGGRTAAAGTPGTSRTASPSTTSTTTPTPTRSSPSRRAYLQGFVDAFEDVMMSEGFEDPATGYPSLLDVGSFVDHFLVNELARNVDAYRLSSFLYKDKDSNDGRLVMGPVWDFNLAFANADYRNAWRTYGFKRLQPRRRDPASDPVLVLRLIESPAFTDAVAARWVELRAGPFRSDSLDALVDGYAALLGRRRRGTSSGGRSSASGSGPTTSSGRPTPRRWTTSGGGSTTGHGGSTRTSRASARQRPPDRAPPAPRCRRRRAARSTRARRRGRCTSSSTWRRRGSTSGWRSTTSWAAG